MGFRWLLSFKYLCFYIFMEVPHTQRFDVLVPKIVIYTSCYLLNCKKRGGVLNWPLLSKLQRTAMSNQRRAGWMCKSSPARFRLQNYYFFLNCTNILRRKRYSAPPPFIIILVNRGIWCYDSIYTAELIIYHSASAISTTTIKIIIISSIIINFKG